MIQLSLELVTANESPIDGKATFTADTSMTVRKNTTVVTVSASQADRGTAGASEIGGTAADIGPRYPGPEPPAKVKEAFRKVTLTQRKVCFTFGSMVDPVTEGPYEPETNELESSGGEKGGGLMKRAATIAQMPVVCADGSEADRRERSRYYREFGPAIIGYMVTLTGVMFVVDSDKDSAWNYLIALPAVPVAMAAWAVYRSVKRVDEFGRMVQVNGMALGFGVSMVGLVVLGLLATIDITPTVGPWIVFGLGMLTWALTSARLLGGHD